ncbi:hypothetical protein Micbo1qcDRAFT_237604 [Microdochium bolleyi]|uniref:Carrier domain-containing protein n=1 Tax=Microdochium bolleyi TaxID=196109 RepID=A0A136IJD5_9PEZI|nr:hypothetical protein Micbo1qcDRAFT_237604 [Microdochium bolleyi]
MATVAPSVLGLIQANISERTDATALTHGDLRISYGDLGASCFAVARLLRAQGVGTGDIVPILTTRCPLAVACVLGVMAVGAAWVPMDAGSWSRQRTQTVLETVDHKCLLVTKGIEVGWLSASDETFVWVGDDLPGARPNGDGDGENKSQAIDFVNVPHPDNCAYIIFTSGTTGRPKGVAVAHRSLLNYVQSGDAKAPFNMGVGHGDAVLLLFSVAFDAYYGVLMSTLCSGGEVVISEPSTLMVDVKRCTILPVTPTLLGTLPAASGYPNIRAVFLGGESPSPELINKWWLPSRKLYNAYGPTEATIATSIAELLPDAPVTLGIPIRGSRMLLLDDELKLCSEGEICISGNNVAMGYYKDKARTIEKFIQWHGGERVYLTGDLGRLDSKGHIVFLGRKDHIVKNRGFLINIEAEVLPALLAQPGVQFAAAFMHRQQLVAFVAPASACPAPDSLRSAMASRYDEFIVPDDLHAVEALPQTANGKIDTTALAALLRPAGQDHLRSASPSAPSTSGNSRSNLLRNAVADALNMAPSSVDMGSSFKVLGGNSLLAVRLMFYLQKAGFTLSMSQLFAVPSLEKASENLVEADHGAEAAAVCQSNTPRMTATQVGIVASTLRDPPRGYMVIRMSIPHQDDIGEIDLEGAWKSVIRQHTIFRASFDIVSGTLSMNHEPRVVWRRLVAPGVCFQDAVQQESDSLITSAREHALSSDGAVFQPLIAFTLVTGDADVDPSLLWLVHHAQIDGWSIGSLVRDVRETLYGDGRPSLAASDFSNYADALHPYIDGVREESARFWSASLSGLLGGTSLRLAPSGALGKDTGRARGQESDQFGSCVLHLGVTLAEADFNARVYQVTPAVAFYAAWALLLNKYSAKEEVVFGTVLSGRNFPLRGGVASIIGPLINTCPFAVNTRCGDTALSSKYSYLAGIHDRLLAMADYQWSAAEVLDKLAPGSHAGIYSTAVFLEYDLDEFSRSYPNHKRGGFVSPWLFERRDIPEFGLTLQGQIGTGGELVFRALFDRTLYSEALVTRMLGHFRNLYLALMDPRLSSVGQVRAAMMDASETLTVTRQSPTLFQSYSGPATLKDAFEAGLDLWPDAVAIESPAEGTLTYRELEKMTNHLARHLNTLIPATGRRVIAVIGDRSRSWIVGALSVVKASAVYLPLDSKLPNQRMRVMVETAGAVACIYPDSKSLAAFPSVHRRNIIVDEILEQLDTAGPGQELRASVEMASTRLPTTSTADDDAYIMFTSGSTGVPKGICISHRSTISHLAYGPARLHAAPGRRHAQMFSPGFDVCIAELFGTLCYGATLVLPSAEDPFAHLGRVHATMMTPSFLSVCAPADLANLDSIYLIGEAVPQSLADKWCAGRTVYNAYGPCECTIAALFKRLEPGEPVTLGRAIPRLGVYILDDERQPVPVGVVGEIYLTGVQVAEGYIGDHMVDVTRAVFLEDPFVLGLRMYKTGDAAAWTESLEVQFLGRLDESLVKVRGYRVELEEVAHAIQKADGRIQAAVAILSDGKDSIFAFLSPKTIDVRLVLEFLVDELPSYARPSVLLGLDNFPTTPNQKLDKTALRQLALQSQGHGQLLDAAEGDAKRSDGQQPTASCSRLPRSSRQASSTEILLIHIWSKVLCLPVELEPSVDDDFLALGGNSLRQITAAQRVSSALGIRIPLRLFVKNTCLRQLAKEVDLYRDQQIDQRFKEGENASESFLSFLSTTGSPVEDDFGATSYLELELFEMHEQSRTPSTFNVTHVVELGGQVDLDVLEESIRQVVEENNILRCCFRRNAKDGQLRRTHLVQDGDFVVHRWQSGDAGKEKRLVQEPFDLARDQLTRVALVEFVDLAQPEPVSKLVLVQHHIITDQTSVRRFFQRLGEIYSRLIDGNEEQINKSQGPGEKPSFIPSYASWARWKSDRLKLAVGPTQERFWKDKLHTASRSPFSRTTHDPSRLDECSGHVSFTAYPPAATRVAVEAPWPMEHYLTAVAAALGQSTGTDDVIICIPIIDRLEPGTAQILGLFLDRLPVRVRLGPALLVTASNEEDERNIATSPRGDLQEMVVAAHREIQAALSEALPGRSIAELLKSSGDNTTAEDLFNVMLVYNRWDDRVAGDLHMTGVTSVRSTMKRAPGAKFPFLVEFNELEDGAVVCEIEYMPERLGSTFVKQFQANLERMLMLLAGVSMLSVH